MTTRSRPARQERRQVSVELTKGLPKLLTDSTTSVWGCAKAESIDVVLHVDGVDVDGAHALLEEVGVVQTLSSTEDLLAAHEEVVRVGKALPKKEDEVSVEAKGQERRDERGWWRRAWCRRGGGRGGTCR